MAERPKSVQQEKTNICVKFMKDRKMAGGRRCKDIISHVLHTVLVLVLSETALSEPLPHVPDLAVSTHNTKPLIKSKKFHF